MEAGPHLIVEAVPGAATAAVGLWVRGGASREPEGLAGITHLIEHLLLRRTSKRTPEEISELVDSMGGAVDAFTTRELCGVTAHVPAERFSEALDLLLEVVFSPRFLARELEVERGVVAAEFDMVQDSPGEVAAERALLACWNGHPLARPVLGRREVVRRLSVRELERYHAQRFTREGLLLVAVGPVTEDAVARQLAAVPAGPWHPEDPAPPGWQAGLVVEEREGLEQLYANLVLPGLPCDHPERATLGVLEQLLGEGTSSRLFRELRDRLGLVYDVGSSAYCASLAGVLEVTFSCPLRHSQECWSAVLKVLEEISRGTISDREIDLARQALLSSLVLGSEGVDSLLDAHAGEFLARGRRFEERVLRSEIEAVTSEKVRALARQLVRLDAISGAVCGPHGAELLPRHLPRRVA